MSDNKDTEQQGTSNGGPKDPLRGIRKHMFKPGQSGNPNGRVKGSVSLVHLLRRKLAEDPKGAEAIIENLLGMAKGGEKVALSAIVQIIDRVDGAVAKKQVLSVTSDVRKLLRLEDEPDEDGDEPS